MTNSNFDHQRAAQEREAMHGNVMAWALRGSNTPEHVPIGAVLPQENGLKCKCLCIGCGQPVLAVNADKSASHFNVPGTLQKHFKHQNATLNNGQCNRDVARKVALRLYVEQGIVELPRTSSRKSSTLPNGQTVHVHMQGKAETMRVVQRVWINDFNVTIVGDDGYECLVTVHSQHSVDEHANSTCVLSLHNVLDASLANLTSEQILALLNDPQRGPRWLRHRDDSKLNALSEADIRRQEATFYGDIPEEWLQGLTGKQRGETILHWLIKRAVSSRGQLRVPAHSVPVVMTMPDGSRGTRNAVCPAGVLVLQDVRLEKRLGAMVPDVICRAHMWNTTFPAVEMLIEAAVTHYVDAEKRHKITDSGLACLEIRADLFQDAGKVHASHIEDLVCTDESIKAWIVHPWMKRYVQEASALLQRRANAMAVEIREREKAVEKLRKAQAAYELWLSKASDLLLAKGYLKVLLAHWEDRPLPKMGLVEVNAEDLWNALTSRGLVNGSGKSLEVRGCLLHLLLRIDQVADDDTLEVLVDKFRQAVLSSYMNCEDAVLLMFALDNKKAQMSIAVGQRYEDQRQILCSEINRGLERRGRTSRLDGLLSLLFPSMRQALGTEYATKKHLGEIRAAAVDAKAAADRKVRVREARMALIQKGRLVQREQKRQSALAQALSEVGGKYRWRVSIHEFPGIGMLSDRYRAKFTDIESLVVFKAARECVACGEDVESALHRAGFTNAEDLKAAVELMQRANICVGRA